MNPIGEKPSFVRRKFVLLVPVSQRCLQSRMQHMGGRHSAVMGACEAGHQGLCPVVCPGRKESWATCSFQQNKNQEAGKKNSVKITSEKSGIWSKVTTHLPFSLQFSSKTALYLSSHLCNDVQLQGWHSHFAMIVFSKYVWKGCRAEKDSSAKVVVTK